MILQLPLKRVWFEMTEHGIKREDYREVTPYFCARLLLACGKKRNLKYWDYYLNFGFEDQMDNIRNLIKISTFQKFDKNIMTLGYPKKTQTEKFIEFNHGGIEIREGDADWGAEPNKLYFVIKHGSRIN